jgi:hypothetical protein
MGKRVIELLVSDLSGEELEAGEGETIDFSYRGKDYTIDLTEEEADRFDVAIQPFVDAATALGGGSSSRRRSRSRSSSGMTRDELQNIRAWARANGHQISDRGRIKSDVIDAYHAAH